MLAADMHVQPPGLSVPTELYSVAQKGRNPSGSISTRLAKSKVVFTEYSSVSELLVEILYCW